MEHPSFTPYKEGHSPFRIGLKPLDLADWLRVDGTLKTQLDTKHTLSAKVDRIVFKAEPETRAAQGEALALIVNHLSAHHGDTHRVTTDAVHVCGRQIALDGMGQALATAGLMVQEDLVLMRRNGDGSGWRIAAASLHFPSSWRLAEKFGLALADVHAPVPGFERGTRTATLIDRIFDGLQVDLPVCRTNFSLYERPDLHHPSSHDCAADTVPDFLRCEYQTLRKLPVSGDILFTIRVHVDPIETLMAHPERETLCDGLARALSDLDADQLRYKGMSAIIRRRLIERLGLIGSGRGIAV